MELSIKAILPSLIDLKKAREPEYILNKTQKFGGGRESWRDGKPHMTFPQDTDLRSA